MVAVDQPDRKKYIPIKDMAFVVLVKSALAIGHLADYLVDPEILVSQDQYS